MKGKNHLRTVGRVLWNEQVDEGEQRLRWLGHIARMDNHRLPKQLLFGELIRTRPRHGTKKRWRDQVAADVRQITDWYEMSLDRKEWNNLCKAHAVPDSEENNPGTTSNSARSDTAYQCTCERNFRLQIDLTRRSRFCDEQPPQPAPRNTAFNCQCERMFQDLTRHSRSCAAVATS